MVQIKFIDFNRQPNVIAIDGGISLMEGAVKNGVPGIEGNCGGVCACATCKVLIDPAWTERIGPAGDEEREMLEFGSIVPEFARLACQIIVTPELDGLTVYTPKNQDGADFGGLE